MFMFIPLNILKYILKACIIYIYIYSFSRHFYPKQLTIEDYKRNLFTNCYHDMPDNTEYFSFFIKCLLFVFNDLIYLRFN